MVAIQHEQISSMQQMFLDALGVGVALLDAQSDQILYANESFCLMLQYEVDELSKSTTLLELVHLQDRHIHVHHKQQLLNGLVDRCRFEARYLKKDGTIVPMRITQTAIRNPPGKLRWITNVLDHVEQPEIADDTSRLTSDPTTVSIWNWTPQNNSGGVAARYDVLLGPPRVMDDPSIEQLTDGVHPDDAKAVQLMLRRSLNGASGKQDYRKLGANGAIRWVREIITPIKDASGGVANVVGISIDVTASMNRMTSGDSQGILAFVQHLETHWDKPLVLAKVAKDHKLSVRSLQKYFGSLGITPLDFLKRIKLAHAYDMLSNPAGRTTVTKVSRRCGFGNLGHFAKDYRTEFGELPSETLLRSRTRSVITGATGPADAT
jgi:PAS domain S-box-containing protein